MVELDSSLISYCCHQPCRYYALVEDPYGNTYPQGYDEFEDLIDLYNSLGDGYSISEIF